MKVKGGASGQDKDGKDGKRRLRSRQWFDNPDNPGMTAPTRPSQIAASNLSKPGRLTPPADRPRSSSITSTSCQPSNRALSARPYCRR